MSSNNSKRQPPWANVVTQTFLITEQTFAQQWDVYKPV